MYIYFILLFIQFNYALRPYFCHFLFYCRAEEEEIHDQADEVDDVVKIEIRQISL